MTRSNALYIHIPFCSHLCGYCDFPKLLYIKKWIKPYLDSLREELDSYNITEKMTTIYIGGGTPSSLEVDELETLLRMIAPYAQDVVEYTVECNIENIDEEKMTLMKLFGVNRLSFGVQSMNDKVLAFADRKHTSADVKKKIDAAKKLGFTHINIDLIYGLPGQTLDILALDVDALIALDVDHIATYSLTVHPHTMFYVKKVIEQNQDDSRAYYDLILNKLRQAGYHRYEVSNFARPGYESKHNQVYWHNLPYFGIGLGASGYVNDIRYDNTRNINHYLSHQFIASQEPVDRILSESYFLMLNLRLDSGFTLLDFQSRYQKSFVDTYKTSLDRMIRLNLLKLDEDRVYATDDGLMKLDYILLNLNVEEN